MTPFDLANWLIAGGVGLIVLGFGLAILGAGVFACWVMLDIARDGR